MIIIEIRSGFLSRDNTQIQNQFERTHASRLSIIHSVDFNHVPRFMTGLKVKVAKISDPIFLEHLSEHKDTTEPYYYCNNVKWKERGFL